MHTIDSILADLRLGDTGAPIYVQLRDQLLAAMGAGRLKAGDRMPTMRQVAVALRIDLNTVRHAYDELERAGAVELIQGRGSFVTAPPAPPDAAALESLIEDLARQALAAARARGIEPGALAQRIAALAAEKGRSQ
jgi:GntR family transcriptional regulator